MVKLKIETKVLALRKKTTKTKINNKESSVLSLC